MKTGFDYRTCRICAVFVTTLMLVACGEDEAVKRQKELFETYTIADLQALVDSGQIGQAIDALNYYRDQGTAENAHLFLQAQIYIAYGDGIAAEVTIERLRSRGASEEETALQLAQAIMLQNRYRDADRALRNISLPPDQLYDAYLLRGDAARSLTDPERAEQFYTAAIELAPERFRAYTAMALLSLETGDLRRAETYSASAGERVEDDSIVSYVQGMVARYRNDIAVAKGHFLRSIELNGSNILSHTEMVGIYLSEGDIPAAESELEIIYSRSPDNPMANYYSALILLNDRKIDEAEDLLLRTGDFTRSYPPAAHTYGMATYELEKYSTAISYLNRALVYFPNDETLRFALADSLTRRGRSMEALNILEPYIADNDSVDGLLLASAAAGGAGNVRAAKRHLERALQIAEARGQSSDELLASLRKRVALARFFDDDIDGATALLKSMYAADSTDIESLKTRANMLMSNGDLEKAEEVVALILAADANNPVGSNLTGAIRHRQGRYAEAVIAYSKALERVPNYQSALKNRAHSYIMMTDYPNARADLEILVKLAPDDPQVVAMTGRALLETGDAAAAIPLLERATDAMPTSAVVAADYAEAVAAEGYFSRAVSLAGKARRLGLHDQDFVAYVDDKIDSWQNARLVQEEAQQAARAARIAKADEALEEERKRQQAIKEESRDVLEEKTDQTELLAELRRLAEENRKLRAAEEEEAARQALEEGRLSPEQLARVEEEKKIRTTRNQLFGLWIAGELGLEGGQAVAYANDIVDVDDSEPGDTDLLRKAIRDMEARGLRPTTQDLQKILDEKLSEAQESLQEKLSDGAEADPVG